MLLFYYLEIDAWLSLNVRNGSNMAQIKYQQGTVMNRTIIKHVVHSLKESKPSLISGNVNPAVNQYVYYSVQRIYNMIIIHLLNGVNFLRLIQSGGLICPNLSSTVLILKIYKKLNFNFSQK